jgi:hypothetical protein
MTRRLRRQNAGKFEVDAGGTVTNVTKTNRWWQFGKRSDGDGGNLGGIAMAAGALPLASLFIGGQASYDDERMPVQGGVSPAMILGLVSCVMCCCLVVLVVGVIAATK